MNANKGNMKKRIINFGCSHAAGVEIAGRIEQKKLGEDTHLQEHMVKHPDNIELNFGNLVAKHFNRDFRITARPGNSNRHIYHDAISTDIQPGDICLLSWTYFGRDIWFNPSDDDESINHCHFDRIHTMVVLTGKQLPLESMAKHPFIKNNKKSIIKSVSKAYSEYFHLPKINVLRYLEWYYATNMTIKQRGGIPINFHFDAELEDWNELNKTAYTNDNLYSADCWLNNDNDSYWPREEISYYGTTGHGHELAALRKYYDEDQSRLKWELYNVTQPLDYKVPDGSHCTYKQWYTNEYHGGPYLRDWPDNRRGHFGPHGHKILSEQIIKFIDSNFDTPTTLR